MTPTPTTTAPPQILRASAGRLRVHLPSAGANRADALTRGLAKLPGVRRVSVRASTQNILIEYDEPRIDGTAIIERLEQMLAAPGPPDASQGAPHGSARNAVAHAGPAAAAGRKGRSLGHVLSEPAGRLRRARVAVRGIDRDPALAHRVVRRLEARPDVRRAVASATTGRVLVEFSGGVGALQDLLTDLSSIELPDTPSEDRPAHPLDPAPIFQSGARALGAGLGLGVISAQRLLGGTGEGPGATAAGSLAGVLGLIDGLPPVRDALRAALGRDRAQLLLGGAAVVSLTLSGSPLGLLVSGAGALRVFTESRQRRDAWADYEQRIAQLPDAQPGEMTRLESGTRVPVAGRVLEGVGTVLRADGLPDPVGPGDRLGAGAMVLRGPLIAELDVGAGFAVQPRPAGPRPDALTRYITALGPVALVYAAVHAAVRRSPLAAFTGLLLVNPRVAVIGADAADTGAWARVLRAGVTVVGTRPERTLRRPDVLLIESPRTLVDGVEQRRIRPAPGWDRAEVHALVSAMSSAGEGAWGAGPGRAGAASGATLDERGLTATVAGRRLRLGPADTTVPHEDPDVLETIELGQAPLVLSDENTAETIATIGARPRLASGLQRLRETAELHGIEIALLERGERRAARAIARRAEVPLVLEADLLDWIRERQAAGDRVAVLSDSAEAAEAFDACDLAIGLSSGRSSRFQARADLLAPGLGAVAEILESSARRDRIASASVGLSALANVAGAAWGLQGEVGILRASYATYGGALAAMGLAYSRLRGGRRSRSVISRLSDPRPERWARLSVEEVLATLDAHPDGLSASEAEIRQRQRPPARSEHALTRALAEQLESPMVAVLGAGAAVSFAAGALADVAIIAAVIAAGAAVGVWQERQAGQAAEALARMGAATGRVLRDGEARLVAAEEIVPGDILLLQSGDRVVADARLLQADALEVDEAALTGESLPVRKSADPQSGAQMIVLEGSDVTVGTGRAVVVAVGDGTRFGATAAALAVETTQKGPLGARLDRLFRQGMPLVLGGGLLVTAAGIAWGGAPLAQLAVGASVAVAAVPEGLPLLAGVAEASVARRLAGQNAYVRRLTAVESLGRVDVVCSDKTGTLTRGQLELTHVDDLGDSGAMTLEPGQPLRASVREVLLSAALASPARDAADAGAHATDGAVLRAAAAAGLDGELSEARLGEVPFDPARALHATALTDRICVKGAAEIVVPRCALDQAGQAAMLARAEALAAQGLRVLMVATGSSGTNLEDPRGLTPAGIVAISDPPRAGAAEALARCRAAGIRVVMVTGDHPATARAIAAQLGMTVSDDTVLTGDQLEHLRDSELAARIERATVLARITPLDKLRVVESLQAAGHTVAMTGDGVNDAPALRLADVGVAMGAGGTEVARQAADLVLGDDRFETLTVALLEGRSLWQNLRRALGLLLGGNLGEVALMAGAAVLGRGNVLNPRQILAINLITDVLPAVAVAVQPPREHELHRIELERSENFDAAVGRAILSRALGTGVPALVAVLAAPVLGAQVPVVAFGAIIATQLAQTLRNGSAAERASRSVNGAVGGSTAVLGAALLVPPLRRFLILPAPNLASLGLIVACVPTALVLASALEQHPRSLRALGRGAPKERQGPGKPAAQANPRTGWVL